MCKKILLVVIINIKYNFIFNKRGFLCVSGSLVLFINMVKGRKRLYFLGFLYIEYCILKYI